jgi:hypothetical protein
MPATVFNIDDSSPTLKDNELKELLIEANKYGKFAIEETEGLFFLYGHCKGTVWQAMNLGQAKKENIECYLMGFIAGYEYLKKEKSR